MVINTKFQVAGVRVIAILTVALFLFFSQLMAEDKEPVKDSTGFEAIDTGVDTIDISGYEEGMAAKYEVVKTKCIKCHSMARVINSKYALPDEWKRYIKRMRRKPGAKIKKSEAKAIWEFLVYDSKQRKADLIKQKLAEVDSASHK